MPRIKLLAALVLALVPNLGDHLERTGEERRLRHVAFCLAAEIATQPARSEVEIPGICNSARLGAPENDSRSNSSALFGRNAPII